LLLELECLAALELPIGLPLYSVEAMFSCLSLEIWFSTKNTPLPCLRGSFSCVTLPSFVNVQITGE